MANCDAVEAVRAQLFSMQDITYQAFQSRLIPGVAVERVIGVRTPQLRAYARRLGKTQDADRFMASLPHESYEENNLHGFLIEQIGDFDECISALNTFLPYVDNWATCDMISPKVLKKRLPELLEQIKIYLQSEHEYTVRFGIGLLMRYFLDEAFDAQYLEMVAEIDREEYYVKMMVAWYFATVLSKQWNAAFPYIAQARLEKWTHNKAIQKAVESRRITEAQKQELKKLRI